VHQIELELQNDELRRTQVELDNARTRYFDLYDLAPVGYCTLSEKGLILEANLRAATLLGIPRGDLISRPLSRSILLEDQNFWYQHLQLLVETDQSHFFQLRMVRNPDGDVFWVRLDATSALDENGIPISRITLTDITESKRAEEVLRAEERLRHAMDGTNAGTWDWNIQTGEASIDEKSAALLGYAPDELKPFDFQTWMSLKHPGDMKVANELLLNHIRGETESYSFETRMKHKDGSWVWVHGRGKIIDWDNEGNPLRMFGTHVDITKRKQAEEKIISLIAEKELILKEVHHRIKNNMGSLHAIFALQASISKSPETVAALQAAKIRVLSMMVIYEKLYKSATFDSISLAQYLPSLMDDIIANFPSSPSVRIEKKIDDVTLDIKKAQTLAIIINELLTNIIKYAFVGRSDGVVSVSVSEVDKSVSLAIHDNGVGLPESVDFADSNSFGLMLVGTLTGQLGGSIRIERGNGTRIVLEFKR
jgi:PAS domain S-box-containing protein